MLKSFTEELSHRNCMDLFFPADMTTFLTVEVFREIIDAVAQGSRLQALSMEKHMYL